MKVVYGQKMYEVSWKRFEDETVCTISIILEDRKEENISRAVRRDSRDNPNFALARKYALAKALKKFTNDRKQRRVFWRKFFETTRKTMKLSDVSFMKQFSDVSSQSQEGITQDDIKIS